MTTEREELAGRLSTIPPLDRFHPEESLLVADFILEREKEIRDGYYDADGRRDY